MCDVNIVLLTQESVKPDFTDRKPWMAKLYRQDYWPIGRGEYAEYVIQYI